MSRAELTYQDTNHFPPTIKKKAKTKKKSKSSNPRPAFRLYNNFEQENEFRVTEKLS